ncbi:MAG: thioredoxin family protein [Tannerellaceae bacterium]|nr:thioredoxin family protein [Tannerellaceae bacterium]
MRSNQGNIRLTTTHFCFLFILFLGVVYVKGWIDNGEESRFDITNRIQSYPDSLALDLPGEGLCFVLFYDEGDSLGEQMEKSLGQLSGNEGKEATYYKVNGPENERICMDYDIAGFPSVLILKDGVEINRIWGVTSYYTLKHIYRRVYAEAHS